MIKTSCDIIKKNLNYTKLDVFAELSCSDYMEALARYKRYAIRFDLIFLDPPYRKGFDVNSVELLSRFGLMSRDCTVVCEHSVEDRLPEQIGHFMRKKEKKYGTVAVSVYGNEV